MGVVCWSTLASSTASCCTRTSTGARQDPQDSCSSQLRLFNRCSPKVPVHPVYSICRWLTTFMSIVYRSRLAGHEQRPAAVCHSVGHAGGDGRPAQGQRHQVLRCAAAAERRQQRGRLVAQLLPGVQPDTAVCAASCSTAIIGEAAFTCSSPGLQPAAASIHSMTRCRPQRLFMMIPGRAAAVWGELPACNGSASGAGVQPGDRVHWAGVLRPHPGAR